MDRPTTAPRRPPSALRRFTATHSEHPVVRGVAAVGRWLVDTCDASNHDCRTNGEAAVLRAFGTRARVILDVGAYVGDWARLAAESCPRARVHCFELLGSTRAQLAGAVADQSRIVVEACGLAEVDGRVPVKAYPSAPWVSSLVDYPHSEAAEWREEPVRTGDGWLREAGIATVDLLKIDAEGGERRVLDGFARALSDGSITAVQVEYGRANIVVGWMLRDIHARFEALGYVVGKVRADGVQFRPYRFEDEDFRSANMLAVTDRPDLLSRLAV